MQQYQELVKQFVGRNLDEVRRIVLDAGGTIRVERRSTVVAVTVADDNSEWRFKASDTEWADEPLGRPLVLTVSVCAVDDIVTEARIS